MRTLAELKQRCTLGTVVEVSRLKFKPVTYFAVIAEHKDRYLGLATTDRAQIGQTEWGTAKRWVLDEHTATQYSHDDDPVALLRLRFLSEVELEALPEAQLYGSEPSDLTA
jgi:hypothetical protein